MNYDPGKSRGIAALVTASFLAVTCACFLLHLVLCMKIHSVLHKRLTKGIIAHMNHQIKIYHFSEFNKKIFPQVCTERLIKHSLYNPLLFILYPIKG